MLKLNKGMRIWVTHSVAPFGHSKSWRGKSRISEPGEDWFLVVSGCSSSNKGQMNLGSCNFDFGKPQGLRLCGACQNRHVVRIERDKTKSEHMSEFEEQTSPPSRHSIDMKASSSSKSSIWGAQESRLQFKKWQKHGILPSSYSRKPSHLPPESESHTKNRSLKTGNKVKEKFPALPESEVEAIKHDPKPKDIDFWLAPTLESSSKSSNDTIPTNRPMLAIHNSDIPCPVSTEHQDISEDLSSIPVGGDFTLKELIESRVVFEVFEIVNDSADLGSREDALTFNPNGATEEVNGNGEDAKRNEKEKERRKSRRYRILKMFSLKGNKKN